MSKNILHLWKFVPLDVIPAATLLPLAYLTTGKLALLVVLGGWVLSRALASVVYIFSKEA